MYLCLLSYYKDDGYDVCIWYCTDDKCEFIYDRLPPYRYYITFIISWLHDLLLPTPSTHSPYYTYYTPSPSSTSSYCSLHTCSPYPFSYGNISIDTLCVIDRHLYDYYYYCIIYLSYIASFAVAVVVVMGIWGRVLVEDVVVWWVGRVVVDVDVDVGWMFVIGYILVMNFCLHFYLHFWIILNFYICMVGTVP